MSELCNSANSTAKIRKTLLTTASALVLAVYGENAQAASDDRPTVWIEGGWQFESVIGDNDVLVPHLDAATRAIGLPSLTSVENALGRTYGAEGSISFQPKGSDWVFAVSARYGRVQSARNILEKKAIVGSPMMTYVFTPPRHNTPITPTFPGYARDVVTNSEAHTIVDFQVGKDIGIGLLGRGTDSVISFGARYAQMNSTEKAHAYVNPDATFRQIEFFGKYRIQTDYHRSATFVERSDSLHALGPSLSLKNTTGLLGTVDRGQLALDWGMNAAVLFGRQKAKASHHSTVRFFYGKSTQQSATVYAPVIRTRSRMVTVPNLGGFAALSYRFPNAKISAGYRADFFFGAKDSGLETRSTTDVGFHGPYATISIGLGG